MWRNRVDCARPLNVMAASKGTVQMCDGVAFYIRTPIVTNQVEILVVTGNHAFTGSVENRGLRVLDVLNDISSQFLKLHEVSIYRGFDKTCVQQVSETVFLKTIVDFVLLKRQPHEAPMRRAHSLISKDRHAALVVLDHYEIHGEFMAKGVIDPMLVLHPNSPQFFPIVSPDIYLGTIGETVYSSVAFVNKAKVSLFHYDRPKSAAEPLRGPFTQLRDFVGLDT
jgi:hypothetical protein